MTVRQLSDNQLRETIRLSEYAFQYKVAKDDIDEWLEKLKKYHRVFGIYEEEQLAAKLHLLSFEVFLGAEKVKMGGVAGVATYPEFRRRGYVKELLKHAFIYMKNHGVCISMLHPFSVAFYRKFGYELLCQQRKSTLTKSDLNIAQIAGGRIKRYNKENHSDDVERVYQQFAARHPGMLVRDRDFWLDFVYDDDWIAAVYYNTSHVPRGYILYNIKDSKMKVEEFVPLDQDARQGLWHFICQHDSMVKEVVMVTPEQEPFFFTLAEPGVKTKIKPYGMVRIVDVLPFFKQYPFNWGSEGEGVFLHISDPFAAWNNLSLRLKDGEVKIVNHDAVDKGISLDINALSTALFGYKRPAELYDIGRISGPKTSIETFDGLIPNNKPFLYDYF
ncbi:enhanced intracellular survival protein Eis [Camelliibacillus cellulosilyticus]|uniref:Enhanced intracellular survival protein Eis n=1 Tax=Camelliibacillus cellulosilyticus TaxID=2174486 RepID=A0ABV9GQW5_9BACL